MPHRTRWWEERKQELVSIARETGPVCVVNEEALNETVFDILSLEAVDEMVFPVALSAHPRMLDALARVGAGFLCGSQEDVDDLGTTLPIRYSSRVLLAGEKAIAVFSEPPDLVRVVTAVFGPDFVSSRPELFLGREALVGVPAHRADADEPDTGPLFEALAAAGARVQGAYLPWGGRVSLERTQTALEYWSESLGEGGVLALGRGMGMAFDEDTARLDIERTNEIVGGLRDLFRAQSVWLDPGERLFSEVGVLLVPVEQVFRSGKGYCIRTPEGNAGAILAGLRLESAPAWNLTGAGRGEAMPMPVYEPGAPEYSAGQPVVVLPVPEPGDVLVLPLFGLPGGTREQEARGSRHLGVCYLNARRICQVSL